MRVEPDSSDSSPVQRSYDGKSNSKSASFLGGTNGTNGTNGHSTRPLSSLRSQRKTYLGHDSEELTRLIIQTLHGMGYDDTANTLMQESGFEVESTSVSVFRDAVLNGNWSQTETLLFGGVTQIRGQQKAFSGLELAEGIDPNVVRFWIRQQKYLELLEANDVASALYVLRSELTPLDHDPGDVNLLSSLLMCESPEELMEQSDWDGARGESRKRLLSRLSNAISSAVMIPESRLSSLLQHYQDRQVANCLYHNTIHAPSLLSDHYCDRSQFPLLDVLTLDRHTNEVWHVQFSPNGRYLATASADESVFIYRTDTFELLHRLSDHAGGAAHIAWSPDSTKITIANHTNNAKVWLVEAGVCLRTIDRHKLPVSCTAWTADSQMFVTGSFDGSMSLWDLAGNEVYSWTGARIRCCAVTPDGRRLIAGTTQKKLLIYNLTTREEECNYLLNMDIMSLSVSSDSRYLLLNVSALPDDPVNAGKSELQLRPIDSPARFQKFTGHKEAEYVLRSGFGGATEAFVVAGSEGECLCLSIY
jgi:hypothetical protein